MKCDKVLWASIIEVTGLDVSGDGIFSQHSLSGWGVMYGQLH